MALVITETGTDLDETGGAVGDAPPRVAVELRDEDENGNPLSGNDRFYVVALVRSTRDDGSPPRFRERSMKLLDVPNGVLTGAQKLQLVSHAKALYSAAKTALNLD